MTESKETTGSIYRYRRIENLLGHHAELESQEIYFASANELNDPMEGFQDVFWAGDHILWKNLIKHYILCLSQAAAIVFIMGPEFQPEHASPVVHWSASKLPTPILKERHEQICSAVFAEPGLMECIRLLARVRTKVRRDELGFYLSNLHGIALNQVMTSFKEAGLVQQREDMPPPSGWTEKTIANLHNILSVIERGEARIDLTSFLFEIGTFARQQLALLQLESKAKPVDRGWRFLAFEFTDFYCKNISSILYPTWYAACFVDSPTHASMWAHYGDKHEGVCLKFRTERDANGNRCLNVNGVVATRYDIEGKTHTRGARRIPLWKVNYSKSFPEIDFFRSLGKLPVPVINRDWYSDGGEVSATARHATGDMAEWRERYWNNLKLVATTKFEDWRYEDESRLVINGLDDTLDDDERKFTYDFATLEGIIFGINTSIDDKVRIMKVIEAKCDKAGRKEFEFSQAHYSSGTSNFTIHRLGLIKPG